MGLLDQYDKAKLYAKGLLGRVAQNYEDLQNSPQKIADLLSNVPSNAQSMYQGLLDAPAQVADLFSQQKAQQLAQALQKPQRANPQQWMDAGMELSGMAPLGGLLAHTVYHGSPHKFDKFDMSKIGTGEGAQAYGHGLYFAESPGVAKSYQNMGPREWFLNGEKFDPTTLKGGDKQAWNTYLKVRAMGQDPMEYAAKLMDEGKMSLNQYGRISKYAQAELRDPTGGNLYKVDIPDEAIPRMLDWDKPLSEQAPEFQDLLRKADLMDESVWPHYTGQQLYEGEMNARGPWKQNGFADNAAAPPISELLKAQGIPGIRYLDGGSRGAGQGTSNFVLFDDQLARILERNVQPTGLLPWQEGEWLNLNSK